MRQIGLRRVMAVLLLCTATTLPSALPAAASAAATAAPVDRPTAELFAAWRAFVRPEMRAGVPDYGPAAMARKAAALPAWRTRLAALGEARDIRTRDDRRLIEAEMNGLDFFLRVLRPWARDPSFYASVFGEQSDVPAHEGPSAEPNIDLFSFRWPLSRADDRRLTAMLVAVPPLLTQARVNLAEGNARDLWLYGDRALHEQSHVLDELNRGTLVMRTLEGATPATMTGASPALRRAIADAKAATDQFAAWVAAEAPKKTGPSGIGKANFDWFAKNVLLSPYDWDAQALLLQRELDRALASLRLEELRNRALPPITPIDDPAAYRAMAEKRTKRFSDFMVDTGLMPDRPYFRAALAAQTSSYVAPADRNFFYHGTALDPLPLLSHSTHWIELARLKQEPMADPVRATAPLFNIFEDRSEGLATGMEELVMHAGLYDDMPRAREIVWIMLANRAARGLASLRVQANEISLAEAGRFHASWTPRGWSDPNNKLVGFEQLLYLRQPGYGPSYVIGKLALDRIFANASHQADVAGRPFVMRDVFARIMAAGILPPSLIEAEMAAGDGD